MIIAAETYTARGTPKFLNPYAECDPPFLTPRLRSALVSVTLFTLTFHPSQIQRLELGEALDGLAGAGKDAEDVEADGLGEGTALANDDLVTGLDAESGGDVGGEVLVALLVTGVLGDEVEVLAADNEGACNCCQSLPSQSYPGFWWWLRERGIRRTVHLGGDDSAGQDAAADGDKTSEGALLVDVGALNGGLGRAEAQTNVLIPSPAAGVLAGSADLVVQEDVRLRAGKSASRSRFGEILRIVRGRVSPYLLLISALGLDTAESSAGGSFERGAFRSDGYARQFGGHLDVGRVEFV